MISVLFPFSHACDADALLAPLLRERAAPPLATGDARVLDFLDEVGQRLRHPALARAFPELAPLGAFLRRKRLETELARLESGPRQLRFPRGLLFHVAPGNADTVFMYSWALAALAGNCNVVRISTRGGAVLQPVLDILNDTARDAAPVIAATQRIASYDRADEATTAALSSACDLRVLWGGDAAIQQIRRAPIAPHARDLTFPNRSSFAVIDAAAYLADDSPAQRRAAEFFHTDAYLFGQAACASPGTTFWIGAAPEVARAQHAFFGALTEVIETRGPQLDAAMAIEKQVATYGLAVDAQVDAIRFCGNAIAQVDLAPGAAPPRRWLGTGSFAQRRLDSLDELAALLLRQDQTLSYYGFTAARMSDFAKRLGGRALDRIVPLGGALAFDPVWDGYDLLREFTRLVSVA
ncbi:Long-chain-fatty-acyl-CoA reductase [Paraburkholderia tropica]|uniref:acyl-CoA reductase n=1 Tax=Paraburkholderia tropica TaxID=92647 RepID=UPI001CB56C4A|nr:acyl-CoA reductase [Paraburkholderia tropica]CAG9192931.1 Long-chain-fatty-acyl-CoA reductase [Paraburkholderia tropica]